MSQPCSDCSRRCSSRGPRSFCGVDAPGRVYWQGVTLLEEHEIAPTYEVYFTGCSLRCRFCTVPDAIYRPRDWPWVSPEALAEQIAAPDVPPFRTISLVGGDPTVNLPYVRALLPVLRARFPGVPLVLNTNLYVPPDIARWCSAAFDWVIGDVHFWQADCARRVAAASDYPDVSTRAAEAILSSGGRLILRILALPGHVDCCAVPTAAWAGGLSGDVRVHMMTHYAPAGHARRDRQLSRGLTEEEAHRALGCIPPGARLPRQSPLPWSRARGIVCEDPAVPLEVASDGRLLIPFVTGSLLPIAVELDQRLHNRVSYLTGED